MSYQTIVAAFDTAARRANGLYEHVRVVHGYLERGFCLCPCGSARPRKSPQRMRWAWIEFSRSSRVIGS